MQYSYGNGVFAGSGELPLNPNVWKLDPADIVEINFLTPSGERRILIDNIQLDMISDNFMRIKGQCEIGGVCRTVRIKLNRIPVNASDPSPKTKIWDIRFTAAAKPSVGEADQSDDSDSNGLIPEILACLRWVFIGWGLLLVGRIVFRMITYPELLRQALLLGAFMAVVHAVAWFGFRHNRKLSLRYLEYLFEGVFLILLSFVLMRFT